jgi:hypothetical protein
VKKLSSILLTILLLLNVVGYYVVFVGMQYKNDVRMTARLDRDQYDENQTVTIRIPLSVPYMTDNDDFIRVDGDFQHEGEFYRLVKQKYANDTLTVICVKDTENKRISEALTNYVKTFTDKASDQQNQGKVSVTFIKDYISQNFELKTESYGWFSDIVVYDFSRNLVPSYFASIVHPPERA